MFSISFERAVRRYVLVAPQKPKLELRFATRERLACVGQLENEPLLLVECQGPEATFASRGPCGSLEASSTYERHPRQPRPSGGMGQLTVACGGPVTDLAG